MYVRVACFRSLIPLALALCAACGGDSRQAGVSTGAPVGDVEMNDGAAGNQADGPYCADVTRDGDIVELQEEDVTARFVAGEPYERTVMLFGGEPVTFDNAVSNVYIIGLDKDDALMLADQYPDFYLCSSPGGQAAQAFILAYDLVPATCEVYDQIVRALADYDRNNARGGDRTSLRLEGAPLTLESVTVDATGEDVTDQLLDRNLHLVTAVEQLTGESVLSFGSSP